MAAVKNLRFCMVKSKMDEYEELFWVKITLEMEVVELSEFCKRHWRKFS